MKNHSYCSPHRIVGFTLVELLVGIGVCSVLLAIGGIAYSAAVGKTRMMTELAAGKTLIAAYASYANDHNGMLMPAMDKTAGSSRNPVRFEPENRNITYWEAPHRYPFRLAPYFGYKINEVLLFNGGVEQINKLFGAKGGMHDYGVSAFPAFGMNQSFVGGYVEPQGELSYASKVEAITRQSQVTSSILVFASAGGTPDGDTKLRGYYKIDAPTSISSPWRQEKWKPDDNSGEFGAVDPRHHGKAVCVFLDGSVKLMSIEELRDMRFWSRNAAEQDNPEYQAVQ